MEKKLIDRWIEALRSGIFPQGRKALCTYNDAGERTGYCCLGVLTYLVDPDHSSLESFQDNRSIGRALPHDICQKIQREEGTAFFATDPMLNHEGQHHFASLLNDEKGLSFNQIADAVERTFRGGKETN